MPTTLTQPFKTPGALRPESIKDIGWVSPEQFFRTIRYVTLKVTNGCNLKCSYCNVDADLPSTPRLSMERYKRVARLLIENSMAPSLSLEFHGGEPLLLSDEWYEEAVNFAAELGRQHGKTLEHPMQTNGTRLTEERLNHLVKLGIKIGISCDGTPHINDRHRMAGNRVDKTLRMMVERNIHCGIILVLSHSNWNEMTEVMNYFQSLGVSGFRVNFMQPQGLGMDHDLLTGEQMFTGIKSVFEHMAATDCAVFEATTQMLLNRFVLGRYAQPHLSCWEHECQAGRIYVAMNLNGDVFSCGTDMMSHRLGHVDEGFSKAHVNQTLCQLHKKDAWYVRCFTCPAKKVCSMSCPTSDHNNINYREAECEYTRRIFQYFQENEAEVQRVHRIIGEKRPVHGHALR